MATLQGAIDEIILAMADVSGINYAPPDPTPQVPVWPAAVVYGSTSRAYNGPPDITTFLHNVVVAVIMPLTDLPICTQVMLPFMEAVPEQLINLRNGRTSSHFETFGDIGAQMGPIEWPQGLEMYGILFTVNELKIQRRLSDA